MPFCLSALLAGLLHIIANLFLSRDRITPFDRLDQMHMRSDPIVKVSRDRHLLDEHCQKGGIV